MNGAISPPLPRNPLGTHECFHSSNFEAVRDWVHARFDLDVRMEPGPSGAGETTVNSAYASGFALSYVHYGAEVFVRLDDAYRFLVPIDGEIHATSLSGSLLCDPDRTFLTSPGSSISTRARAGVTRLNCSFDQDALARQFVVMTGSGWRRPLEFYDQIDLTHGVGGAIRQVLLESLHELSDDDSLAQRDFKMARLRDWVLSTLLLFQPHSHSQMLAAGGSHIAPRDVKIVLDYIDEHVDAVRGLEDLVKISGVPGRTLYDHFQRFKGMPPMAYVRKVRIEKIREDLSRAGPNDSVTRIAARWGFTHAGRLAKYYKDAYGEPPSATLARSRNRF